MSAYPTDITVFDFLAPATDAGVAAQFAGWAGLSAMALIASRNNRDLRLLSIGISVLLVGIMAVRAVH